MSNLHAIADRVEIEALRGEFIDAAMMARVTTRRPLRAVANRSAMPSAEFELCAWEAMAGEMGRWSLL